MAQCVEAISKKQARIPYRESKMTRILSLGQNNGLTVMILNLAPVRSYHQDTLSSLNFANRTKKIEVRDVENEPVFKGPPRPVATFTGRPIQRQPLRALGTPRIVPMYVMKSPEKPGEKPRKAFVVYSDETKARQSFTCTKGGVIELTRKTTPLKRGADALSSISSRPAKTMRPQTSLSKAGIEEMVEKKVESILATRGLQQSASPEKENTVSEQVQRRLELLEQKIEGKEDARAEGLTYLLMAKQHHVRNEDVSALKMYELAQPFFPSNDKLQGKIDKLRDKLKQKREGLAVKRLADTQPPVKVRKIDSKLSPRESQCAMLHKRFEVSEGSEGTEYFEARETADDGGYESDDWFRFKEKSKRGLYKKLPQEFSTMGELHSPRTQRLLRIVNSRDVEQIKLLKGIGAKKAEAIVDCLCEMDNEGVQPAVIGSLMELGTMRGVSTKMVENMRNGLVL